LIQVNTACAGSPYACRMGSATDSLPLPRRAAARPALDEREEWEEFSRPCAGRDGLWESYLAIEGMYCAACTLTIEQALAGCRACERCR
jgi:Cu2+-exporting ATPase